MSLPKTGPVSSDQPALLFHRLKAFMQGLGTIDQFVAVDMRPVDVTPSKAGRE